MWTILFYFFAILLTSCTNSIQLQWCTIFVIAVVGLVHYNGYLTLPSMPIPFTSSRNLFAFENDEDLGGKKKKKKAKTLKREEKPAHLKTKKKKRKRKKSKSPPHSDSEKAKNLTKVDKAPVKGEVLKTSGESALTEETPALVASVPQKAEVENGGFTVVKSKSKRKGKKKGKKSSKVVPDVKEKETGELQKVEEMKAETTEEPQEKAQAKELQESKFTREELQLPPEEEIEAMKAATSAEIAALEAKVKALRERQKMDPTELAAEMMESNKEIVMESKEISKPDTVDLTIDEDYVYVNLPSTQGEDDEWSTVGRSGKAKITKQLFHCGSEEPAFQVLDQNHVKADKKVNLDMYGEGRAMERAMQKKPSPPRRFELEFAIPAMNKEVSKESERISFGKMKVEELNNSTKEAIQKNTKPKRKRHRLYWGEICDVLKIESYEIVNASPLYNACFLHAIHKRELKLREIRGIFQSALFKLQECPQKYASSTWSEDRIQKLISELQNWLGSKPRVALPRSLWSPEPLKCAVANAIGQAIVIVNPFQVKSTDEPITVNDLVICERFDPDGSMHVVTDKNMRDLLSMEQLCFIYFPSEQLKHWFYFQFS